MNKDRLSIQSSLRIFLDPTELGTELLRIAHYILASLRIGMKDSKTPEKIPRSFWKPKEIPEISFKKKDPETRKNPEAFCEERRRSRKAEKDPVGCPHVSDESFQEPPKDLYESFESWKKSKKQLNESAQNPTESFNVPWRTARNKANGRFERIDPGGGHLLPDNKRKHFENSSAIDEILSIPIKNGIETSLVICSTKFMFHYDD